jgi:hypothetical protein
MMAVRRRLRQLAFLDDLGKARCCPLRTSLQLAAFVGPDGGGAAVVGGGAGMLVLVEQAVCGGQSLTQDTVSPLITAVTHCASPQATAGACVVLGAAVVDGGGATTLGDEGGGGAAVEGWDACA